MKTGKSFYSGIRYFRTPWVAGWLIACLSTLLYLVAFTSFHTQEKACICLLVSLTLFCAVAAYQLVRQGRVLIFSPMPWFLLASGVYFGFGPLLYFFGDERAISYSQDVWRVNIDDLLRVTFLNVIGIILVFGMWLWQTRAMPRIRPQPLGNNACLIAILIFYLIGLPPRLITILSECGLVPFTAPGFMGWFANMTGAGLILVTTMTLRNGGSWWLAWVCLLALDIIGGMVTFSKMSIIIAVVPCIFGYMLHRPKQWVIQLIPVFLLLVYLAAHSFVKYARGEVLAQNSILSRIEMAQSYLNSEEDDALSEKDQAWWIRLNYANVQAYAMKEYESGNPGDSLMLALIAPIPRLLWRDKPTIESGREFYRKLTGSTSASFGMGFFAEIYWNGGWLMVVFCSCAIGWLFGKVTQIIGGEQAAGNIWVLPIMLIWIRAGARVDGWIHTEIAGPAMFTLIYMFLLRSWLGPYVKHDTNIQGLRPRRINGDSKLS